MFLNFIKQSYYNYIIYNFYNFISKNEKFSYRRHTFWHKD